MSAQKLQLFFVPANETTQKEIEVAKMNYVMINWCDQIFTETYLNRFGTDLYVRITGQAFSSRNGIDTREYSHELCTAIKNRVCRIDWLSLQAICPVRAKSEDPKNHVHYVCDNKRMCTTFDELIQAWDKDKKFEFRFPPEERRRIRQIRTTLEKTTVRFQTYNVDVAENCLAFSFLPVSCRARRILLDASQTKDVGLCTYVVSSVLSDIFGLTSPYLRSRATAQCVLNETILKEMKDRCNTFDVNYLRLLSIDILVDVLSSMMDRVEFTHPFQRWLALEDFHKLVDWNRQKAATKEKKQLCDEITFLFSLSERYLQVGISWYGRMAKRGLLFLQLVGATYVDASVVRKVVLYAATAPSDELIDTLTFSLNFTLYLLRFWLSWKVFLLLYPDGRRFLEKILRDPVQLASFVLSLFALGVPSEHLRLLPGERDSIFRNQ